MKYSLAADGVGLASFSSDEALFLWASGRCAIYNEK